MRLSFLEKIGNEKIPSTIKDPFQKNSIRRVAVSMSNYGSGWSSRGSVEFTNGNTRGEQSFEGKDFDEIVLKIKAFIKELK